MSQVENNLYKDKSFKILQHHAISFSHRRILIRYNKLDRIRLVFSSNLDQMECVRLNFYYFGMTA